MYKIINSRLCYSSAYPKHPIPPVTKQAELDHEAEVAARDTIKHSMDYPTLIIIVQGLGSKHSGGMCGLLGLMKPVAIEVSVTR